MRGGTDLNVRYWANADIGAARAPTTYLLVQLHGF
jgi:hypothetical protein